MVIVSRELKEREVICRKEPHYRLVLLAALGEELCALVAGAKSCFRDAKEF
jgi:hypothetical protein